MKKSELMEVLKGLRIECSQTKAAVAELENFVAVKQEEFDTAKRELRELTEKLAKAVQADAKATVKLLKAEARARLAGLLLEQVEGLAK